jgi:hypothetical protein
MLAGRAPDAQDAAVDRVALESSVVVSAGYDPATQVLELEFASGRIYQFEGVPPGTYQWLLRTPSKGSYVARMINDRYAYRDVTSPPPETQGDLAERLRASLEGIRGDTDA